MGKLKDKYRQVKYSFKYKLFIYLFAVLLVFVTGFEIFSYISLKNYYYNNISSLMYAQAKYSSELYLTYLADYSLMDNVVNNRDQFFRNSQGQIQILDNNGRVLLDSNGSEDVGNIIDSPDVQKALVSETGVFTNRNPRTGEKYMSLSHPLNDKNKQVGMIRIISSLGRTDQEVFNKFKVFILFGVISIFLSLMISYLFSNAMIKPINKLTEVAKKFSDGQYKNKADINTKGEIGELAKTMNTMSENILKKEEIKNEFISSVSHELRTPLTSIKGWSITLQDESIDRELLMDGLEIIEKETDRLSDMVEDLLDFSRFTSPKFSLSKTNFNIVEISKNIVNQLTPRTKEKDISLLLNYENENLVILADENRMKQVFINLLDNAIKFTPIGGTIAVNIIDGSEEIMIEVIDTGIGISEDDIELVTTKFFKGTSSGSHTGLGLSICEEIVKEHKGELTIESKENVGTTVAFTIPKEVRAE